MKYTITGNLITVYAENHKESAMLLAFGEPIATKTPKKMMRKPYKKHYRTQECTQGCGLFKSVAMHNRFAHKEGQVNVTRI